MVPSTALGDIFDAMIWVEMKISYSHTAQGSIDCGKRVQAVIGLISGTIFIFVEEQDCLQTVEIIGVTREGVLLGFPNNIPVIVFFAVMAFGRDSESETYAYA